jgi:hypothetical protein
MAQLSDSQLVVLNAACQRPDRSVYPLTAKLPGAAAAKVLGSLINKSLIKEVQAKRDDTVWREDKKRGRLTLRATPKALDALGIDEREAATEVDADQTNVATASPEPEAVSQSPTPKTKEPKARRARDGSKQAKLIEMLRRAKGATVQEIAEAFSWQHHTVRGAIAGALKKKLGLNVTSEKDERRGRVYKISA